jgi:putative FmdB family regulatory protein
MPIYEYVCDDCKKPFEKLVMSQSEKITCPQCGGRHHKLQLSVIASPSKSAGGSSSPASGGASGGGCCSPSGCGCH